MKTLNLKDLAHLEDSDREALHAKCGGMGRTPMQVLTWELTRKPATWKGLVLEDYRQLHQAVV